MCLIYFYWNIWISLHRLCIHANRLPEHSCKSGDSRVRRDVKGHLIRSLSLLFPSSFPTSSLFLFHWLSLTMCYNNFCWYHAICFWLHMVFSRLSTLVSPISLQISQQLRMIHIFWLHFFFFFPYRVRKVTGWPYSGPGRISYVVIITLWRACSQMPG